MTRRTTLLLLSAALVAGVLLVYAPVAGHDWVAYDDDVYLLDNPHVARGLEPSGIRWAFTHELAGNYHPVTLLSHQLDVELFGLEPGPHHLVSAGLHALVAVLVLFFLATLLESAWAAGIGAALFALHPLRVESVAWASERKDVLCAVFFVSGLLLYLRYGRRPSLARGALVCVMLALALLSKPMAVSFPLVTLLLDVWPLRRLRWDAPPHETETGPRAFSALALVREKLPLFALAAAGALATLWVQSSAGATSSLDGLPPGLRVLNALAALAIYGQQSLVPRALSVFYPHALQLSETPLRALLPAALAGGLLLAGLLVLAWRTRRSAPAVTVGLGMFLVTLVPVIGLVQVGAQAHADRYTYLPSIGLVAAVAGLASSSRAGARRVLALAGTGAALCLAVLARAQVGVWRDTRTLFSHALEVEERNFLAHSKLGEVALAEGDEPRARAAFERSLELNPGHVETLNLLALCHLQSGGLARARELLERASKLAPEHAQTWLNLGMVELERADREGGELGTARRHFETARRLAPSATDALFDLAYVAQRERRLEEAERLLLEVLALDPAHSEAWSNLGQVRLAAGRVEGALEGFENAVRLAPDDALAHFNLGKAREKSGNREGAAQAFRRALELDPELAPARAALRTPEEGG